MKYILPVFASLLLLTACDGSSEDRSRSTKVKPDCQTAFSNDHEKDSASFHLSIDDVPSARERRRTGETLTPASAELAIKAAGSQAGCEGDKLLFDEGTACSNLIAGDSTSRACFAQIADIGFFFVSETMPDGIAVLYSRFD